MSEDIEAEVPEGNAETQMDTEPSKEAVKQQEEQQGVLCFLLILS